MSDEESVLDAHSLASRLFPFSKEGFLQLLQLPSRAPGLWPHGTSRVENEALAHGAV